MEMIDHISLVPVYNLLVNIKSHSHVNIIRGIKYILPNHV